jgi:hypothetical protein
MSGFAVIDNNIAKQMTKLAAVIQVPFCSTTQFLSGDGLQVRGPLLPADFELTRTKTRTSTTAYETRLELLQSNTPTWAVPSMAL